MNPKELATQYDRIGGAYIAAQEKFIAEHGERPATVFIRKAIGDLSGKTVLDVGCGDGRDMVTYHLLGAEKVFGIDSSRGMVRRAYARFAGLSEVDRHAGIISYCDIERTGSLLHPTLPSDYFDVVTAKMSLHYVRDLDKAYNNLARVLRPNGALAFVVHHPASQALLPSLEDDEGRIVTRYELFDEKVQLHTPFHELGDYFSPTFFDRFDMVDFSEGNDGAARLNHSFDVPTFMGVKAARRAS